MCIIIHRPKGAAARLSRDTIARCCDNNPHGFGMMWVNDGKVLTARYMPSQRKDFIKRALMLQAADLPLVLHFRWATHGAVEKANTHPFIIEKGKSAMCHNGILSIPCVKGWSDTRTFCNEILQRLPAGWESDPALYWLVDQATMGSKVAIMYADGAVTILHKNAGITEQGIWYSNDGFRAKWDSADDWKEAAKRWSAKEAAKAAGNTTAAKASASVFTRNQAGKGKLPIQSSSLYRFEGITICGWCLAREAGSDDALEVDKPAEGEQCELCYHSPHIAGSRDENAVKWMNGGPAKWDKPGVEVEVTLEEDEQADVLRFPVRDTLDEGRICTGA
jgi:hypothetical protein